MKNIIKTYCVDVITLILVFILGVFSKNFIESFFEKVDVFESQVGELGPELANQSMSAFASVEGLIQDFNVLVWFAFVFMIFVVPALLYLLFSVSQSLNFALIKNKVTKKYILKSVIYGLPLLLLFFVLEGQIISGIVDFMTSGYSLLLLLFYLILVFLMVYTWFVIVVLLLKSKKINLKFLYKKAYKLLPVFMVFGIFYFLSLNLVGYGVVSFVTDSFSRNEGLYLGLFVLILLIPVQFIRSFFVKIVG